MIIDNSKNNKILMSEFLNSKNKCYIYCDTKHKANLIISEFDKFGKVWADNTLYNESNNKYNIYKNLTCYDNKGSVSNIMYCGDMGHKIYSFESVQFDDIKNPLILNMLDLLNLKLDTPFKIKGYSEIFKFTVSNLMIMNEEYDEDYEVAPPNIIRDILFKNREFQQV